jgi:adenine-specific DNA glycosylase
MNDVNFEARMMVLQTNIEVVMNYFAKIMGQQTDLLALVESSNEGDLSSFMDMIGLLTRMEPAFAALAEAVRKLEKEAK